MEMKRCWWASPYWSDRVVCIYGISSIHFHSLRSGTIPCLTITKNLMIWKNIEDEWIQHQRLTTPTVWCLRPLSHPLLHTTPHQHSLKAAGPHSLVVVVYKNTIVLFFLLVIKKGLKMKLKYITKAMKMPQTIYSDGVSYWKGRRKRKHNWVICNNILENTFGISEYEISPTYTFDHL